MITPGRLMSIKDFFEDNVSLTIPSYQRPYAWTRDQVKDLIDDINSSKGDEHYMGAVYIVNGQKHGQTNDNDIVDGQQRTTTLSIFALAQLRLLQYTQNNLKNYIDIEEEKYRKFKEINNLIDRFTNILFNNYDESKIRLNLSANDNVAWRWLISSTKNGFEKVLDVNFEIKTKSQKRVIDTYNQIYTELRRVFSCINNEEKLHIDIMHHWGNLYTFVNTFLTKLKLITMRLTESRGTSVFKFFSLINNRGKKLSWLDDIKCTLLQSVYEWTNNGNSDYSEIIKLWGELMIKADETIDNYFLTYWNANYKWSTKSKIEERFIEEFIENELVPNKKIIKIKSLLNKMILNYDQYKIILNPESNQSFNQRMKNELNYIKNYKVVHPLILSALINKIPNNDLYSIVRRARILVWSVIGIQGRKSSTVEKYIKKDKIAKYLETNGNKLSFKLIDYDFKNELNKTSFFENGSLNKNVARNLLKTLRKSEVNHHISVEFLNEGRKKDNLISSYNKKTWDKEHIIPEGWKKNEQWRIIIEDYIKSNNTLESEFNKDLEKLGNLIPLSEDINRSIKNKFIDQKIENYKKSDQEHIKELVSDITVPNILKDIDKRTEKLTDKIIESKIFDFNLPE